MGRLHDTDRHWLSVADAAKSLRTSEASVRADARSGRLPNAHGTDGTLLISARGVADRLLHMAAQPLLIVRAEMPPEAKRPRTRRQQRVAFNHTTGLSPEGFLVAWDAGDLELSATNAELVVQAQELLSRERTRRGR